MPLSATPVKRYLSSSYVVTAKKDSQKPIWSGNATLWRRTRASQTSTVMHKEKRSEHPTHATGYSVAASLRYNPQFRSALSGLCSNDFGQFGIASWTRFRIRFHLQAWSHLTYSNLRPLGRVVSTKCFIFVFSRGSLSQISTTICVTSLNYFLILQQWFDRSL